MATNQITESVDSYYYSVIAEFEKHYKTMYAEDAERYLHAKYPNADISRGVKYGMIDVMIAEEYNLTPKDEWEDLLIEKEVVILL